MAEEYDPEKATLRVEYAQATTAAAASADGDMGSIECEIRCDASTWASGGIDVVVDPPPTGVSCLARHRLSAGGGLWLTIEHAQNVVAEEGKVVATVRRGTGGSGASGYKDKSLGGAAPTTSVIVNGARVKVDVEVLDEEKIRELEKRKRVKPAPVPLDQYETLGPRPGQPNQAVGFAAGRGSPGSAVGAPVADFESEKPVGEKVTTGAVDDNPAAAGLAIGANGEAAAPPSDSAIAPDSGAPVVTAAEVAPPKPPLDPPACALEALAWLQTFHAEQGPELTDPAPGWSIVSERGGIVVRKKLLPAVSETFPVYRGDKIVQGLTAEEIASIVTSVGCRKAWDERVDNAVPLASYGHGVTTCAITTKPTFPFKSRIFFVASVNAAVKVPSASSGASTSTVLFVASASYMPLTGTASDPFDPSKVNPSSYLAGQVLLEGWILETLDPYTSSVLAIPSTRCTYVACMDQKGSVPLALNQILNANLARSISNVEQLGKTRGPLPRLWAPSAGVQIEGPLSDDSDADFVWKLSPSAPPPASPVATAGESSAVITVDFDLEDGSFRSLLKVGGKKRLREPSEDSELLLNAAGSKLATNEKTGGGKSKPIPLLAPSLPVGTSLLKSELPRSASLNLGTAAPPILQKAPIISELSHKTSRSSLRSKSPPAAPSTTTATAGTTAPLLPASKTGPSSSVTDPGAHDLVVAELVVDLKQFPHGYAVTAVSQLLPAAGGDELLSLDALPGREPGTTSTATPPSQLPLRCVAHDAPLPSILTASLDAWKRANHLVRVLVPTGAITHPIQDPLRAGDESSKPAPPEWFRLLFDGPGALVEIKIVALPAPRPVVERSATKRPKDTAAPDRDVACKVTGQAAKTVIFNGDKLVVQPQKESKAVLSRFEDDELPLQGAKISRFAAFSASSRFRCPH